MDTEQYDFNGVTDRKGSSCIKYDSIEGKREDIIPLWIADMDFKTPDFIVDAIKQRCRHEIFGYHKISDSYYESIIGWVADRHGWKIRREWINYIPGIVNGIGHAIECFTKPGDSIIIQPPVYHPFRLVPQRMGRKVVYNPLKMENGRYRMDFKQLEEIMDSSCRILILCNPHNPGGTVWEKETLVRLADLCRQRGILVISDEIHSELVYPEYTHHPFASVSEAAASCSITFMAPSKTFNIAGIISSYSIVPDERIREKFYSFLQAGEFNNGSIFSYIAAEAAYRSGKAWLDQLLAYLKENIRFTDRFLKERLPRISIYEPQASFLIWLDCRGLELEQEELVEFFEKEAGLLLNDGSMFGDEGKGYMRLNIGCPRSVLQKALTALEKACIKRWGPQRV